MAQFLRSCRATAALICLGCGSGGQGSLRAELAASLGPIRPVEGRLEGVAYAPFRARPIGSTAVPSAGKVSLGRTVRKQRAQRLLVGNGHSRRSPDDLGARALLQLIGADLSGAANSLADAARHDPEPARWWSDLAAVRLQQAQQQKRPYYLFLALAAAERAWRANPAMLAAAFNRALMLEKLCLRGAALAAWEQYLAGEQDAFWRQEAEAHIRQLRLPARGDLWLQEKLALDRAARSADRAAVRQLVRQFPQESREAAEGGLLAQWARARRAGALAAAEDSLRAAGQIGDALAQTNSETMLRDTVAVITSAAARYPDARLPNLIAGHLLYDEGVVHYRAGEFGQAARSLMRARVRLAAAGSPFAGWADFQIARCAYHQNNYPEARSQLVALVAREDGTSHLALRGNGLNVLGLVQFLNNDVTASLDSYSASAAIFAALGEAGNRALAESSIATDLDYLDEEEAVWGHLQVALSTGVEAATPATAYLAFERAALSALHLGEPDLALYFQDEVVRAAHRSAQAATIAEALRWRASMWQAAGNRQHALVDLHQAEAQLSRLRDQQTYLVVEADILRVRGEIERPFASQEALSSLNRAVAIYRQTHYHYFLARVLLERALLLRRLGRFDDVEKDLLAAVNEREGPRRQIADPWDRIHFFDDMPEIFDTMVEFQIETRNRPELAFDYLERGRARLMLDLLDTAPGAQASAGGQVPGGTRPLTASQVLSRLPPRTAVIEYLLLPNRLLTWVLRPPGVLTFHQLPCDRAMLGRLIRRLDDELASRNRAGIEALGAQLYETLLTPLRHDLPAGWDLVIVPSGTLHTLPFPALCDRRTRKFLIEDHALAVAPSASAFLASQQHDRRLRGLGWRRVLAVNDPAIDQRRFPDLPRLPLAGEAVGQWIVRHPGSRVLAHEQASRAAFLQVAGDFPIIHFSGHAMVNSESPQLSRLLLAATYGRGDAGELFAWDLLGRRFAHTRLVILAGCSTAAGQLSAGEGSLSLAMPFLAAGVPGVIGSLWKVDDEAAERLFASFYRQLDRGASPMAALQRAAVQLLQEERAAAHGASSSVWAAFELSGAAS